jgi:hypothetical protein
MPAQELRRELEEARRTLEANSRQLRHRSVGIVIIKVTLRVCMGQPRCLAVFLGAV